MAIVRLMKRSVDILMKMMDLYRMKMTKLKITRNL